MDRVARAYGVRPSAMLGLGAGARCSKHPASEMGKPTEAGWGNRPARLTDEMDSGGGVGDWLTYTFDRAVWMWGQWVESKLAERDAHGRAVWSLERLLAESIAMGEENFGRADQLMALVGEGVRVKP